MNKYVKYLTIPCNLFNMGKAKEEVREKILKLLAENPDGLTIQKLSELTGASRITVAKYIAELVGSGIVVKRQVGAATLCYLKDEYMKKVKEGKLLEILEMI